MMLLKFVPIKLTICLVLGILMGHYLEFSWRVPLVYCIFLLIGLLVLYRKSDHKNSTSFGLVALLLTLGLGILAVTLWNPKNRKDHYSHFNYQNERLWKVKISEVLKSTSFSDRYIGLIFSMDEQTVSGKFILNQYRDSLTPTYRVDDELFIFKKPDVIGPPLNPNQFNYKSYLENLGIYHQLQINKNNTIASKNSSPTLYGFAASLRNKIISKLQETNFSEEELSMLQALLLGQRNSISEETYSNYKNAGAVHILALSGLHIGILLFVLQWLLQPLTLLPKGKTIKLCAIVLLLWFFAFLAGFSASIVRAVMMFSFVAYAMHLNRPQNTFNIMALSIFAILLVINPMLLFQVGFQMSYAAVFAIVWIYPMLQRFWFPKNRMVRKVWQLLSVSIAAQLGVLPISLFYFHQFPSLFFISNLLIVPALELILTLGIVTIILAFFDVLPQFFITFYGGLIRYMNFCVKWVAQQEAFIFKNVSFDIWQLLIAYGILISLLLLFTKRNFKSAAVFFTCIICFQSWTIYTLNKRRKKEVLIVAHRSKNSVLLHQFGHQLYVSTTDSSTSTSIIKDYRIAERIQKITHQPLKNSYQWHDKTILIMDSSGIYTPKESDYVILTQSPKINLNRMIDRLKPKKIIADGSNYKRTIDRWKKTCRKRKLPFHYTGEKGAYYFE